MPTPGHVHRTIAARAAGAGLSLLEYLRILMVRDAARPSPQEWAERVRLRGPVDLPESSADLVRTLRDHGE